MRSTRYKRPLLIAGLVLAVLGAAAAAGLHYAAGLLKTQVEQALGADSEVRDITLGWSGVEIHGIRIRAPKGWPAADTLRAERVVVRPDLLGLFSARVHVPRITVEHAYVSAVRTRAGKVRLLPSLLEAPRKRKDAAPSTMPEISIGTIELRDGALEFFDATVRQPAHKTRLEQLDAQVDDLRVVGAPSLGDVVGFLRGTWEPPAVGSNRVVRGRPRGRDVWPTGGRRRRMPACARAWARPPLVMRVPTTPGGGSPQATRSWAISQTI